MNIVLWQNDKRSFSKPPMETVGWQLHGTVLGTWMDPIFIWNGTYTKTL